MKRFAIIFLLLVAVLLSGCGSSSGEEDADASETSRSRLVTTRYD